MAHVVVPIAALDSSAQKALAHARTIGRARAPIVAVHVAADRASAARLRREWEASAPDAELVILEAARDRRHPSPLLVYLDLLHACAADSVTVVLPTSACVEALHDRPGIVVEAVPTEHAG
jgi:uncharacterized NAD-dependent epimerase/dehydratase family protein